MKVKIGPHPKTISIYYFQKWLENMGVSEKIADKIYDFLEDTWVDKVCRWINERMPRRTMDIKIHSYDVWNMDDTLVMIVQPMLHRLAKDKHGTPYVDPEDVPQNMWPEWYKMPEGREAHEMYEEDETYFKRWDFVFTELVWTFDTLNMDWEDQFHSDGYDKVNKRIDNGLRLFGKYFRALWD